MRDNDTPASTDPGLRSAPVFPGEAIGTAGTDTDRSGGEDEVATETGTSAEPAEGEFRLMEAEDAESFRTRWHELQSLFVDDPRRAVKEADELVAAVMQKLATTFADHRKALEGQWREGEDVDTEHLRRALRHYRAFFHRLLSTERQPDSDPGDAR